MRVQRVVAFALAIAAGLVPPLAAQDVETRAAIVGRTLPPGYYERIARDPDAFELGAGWRARLGTVQGRAALVAGTLPIVVVPTLFAESAPPPAVTSSAAMQSLLFDGPADRTVTGYFREASFGRLDIRGQVTEWTPTTLTIQQVVGTSRGLGGDARVGEWLRQSIAAVDASVDFRQFDNDGPDGVPNSADDDGRVDAAAFLFHEIDASCGGPGIWPHRSRVSGWGGGAAVTSDLRPGGQPIVVDDYIVLGARDCSGARPLAANVFAHETGHVLGLPDYYDSSAGILREQRRWVVGCWDLMSAGAWGCGTGPQPQVLRPAHMGPFPRELLGWITSRMVPADTRDVEFTLRPAHTSGDALRIAIGPNEHLLVEYRERSGFDSELPASGVLVHHVQTGRAWLPPANAAPRRYGYALVEADRNGALSRPETQGGNRGEATDAFGTTLGAIHNGTHDLMRLNGGAPSTVTIHAITVDPSARVARVRLTTAAQPAIALAPVPPLRALSGNARAEFPVGGGAMPYTLVAGAAPPAGLSVALEEDRIVVTGTPLVSGTVPLALTVRDANGVSVTRVLTLPIADADIATSRLLGGVAGGAQPLSAAEIQYLDAMGNRNGRLDVGDVRAYLLRTGRGP